jgi:hypothetical protein
LLHHPQYEKRLSCRSTAGQPYSPLTSTDNSLPSTLFAIAPKTISYFIDLITASDQVVGPQKMSTPNNTPPYTAMPSLGHELGVMFGFIVACLLIMAVYIYFWRGMQSIPPTVPTFHKTIPHV